MVGMTLISGISIDMRLGFLRCAAKLNCHSRPLILITPQWKGLHASVIRMQATQTAAPTVEPETLSEKAMYDHVVKELGHPSKQPLVEIL